jgi:lysyl endopeptidase
MRLLLAVVLSCLALPAAAFTPDLAHLDELPMHALPAQKVAQAMAAKPSPVQFAVPVALPLTLSGGRWDALPGGIARWRTRVFSAGAESLNFEFSRARLPDGAQLWLYDVDGSLVQGPYTRAQVARDGKLWTAVVLGETAVLELRVPAAQRRHVDLRLATVNHGFRFLGKQGDISKSGHCNVDVRCPLGNAWTDETRSVARIQVSGRFFCSGQMVNNRKQDDRLLFLTAHHCEVDQTSDSSVVFYWNYEASACNGTRNGPLNHTQNGSTWLADDANSDFTLLQLAATPNPAYNVFLAGFDASGTAPACGVAIHHPSGDEKAISGFNGAARDTVQLTSGGPVIQAWRVTWAQGTTEPGSSGGGLWSQGRQLIGLLSGGEAACTTSNPNIDNDAPDFFGRLDAAWQAQAPTNHRLDVWLDPDTSGIKTSCGKYLGGAACTTPAPATCPIPVAGGTMDSGGGGGGGGALSSLALLMLGGLGALRRRRG